MRRIGLISDTHGLLRPRALAALQGCDPIIHAGDVGDLAVLAGLGEVAELFAIRGMSIEAPGRCACRRPKASRSTAA
jgi:predicted phosphodiesterase